MFDRLPREVIRSQEEGPLQAPEKVRVAIVDDDAAIHAVFRHDALLARAGMELAAAFTSSAMALSGLAGRSVDVLVVDQGLCKEPLELGIDLIAYLQRAMPDLPCVLFTADTSSWLAADAIRRGARGALRKGGPMEHLAMAVRMAAIGQTFVEPEISTEVLAAIGAGQFRSLPRKDPDGLTDAEVDVLILVAMKLTNAQVGDRRGTSEETIRAQVQAACRKLGAHTRHEAVAEARQRGYLGGGQHIDLIAFSHFRPECDAA